MNGPVPDARVARRPNKAPRGLPACSPGLGATPPPSKTRRRVVNRLFSSAGPHNRRVTDSPGRRCVRPPAHHTPAPVPDARPRDARTNRLTPTSLQLGPGPPRARATPLPSKTRHLVANRLFFAACSRTSCARVHARNPRPRDARTNRLGLCQLAARALSHATSSSRWTARGVIRSRVSGGRGNR